MKNIHIIPTDRPSRLSILNSGKLNFGAEIMSSSNSKPQHIYITSDEEIKDCWVLNTNTNEVYFLKGYYGLQPISKKIILTTDQDLIKDGVQSIDDEFLEWFVNNPSCDYVDVKYDKDVFPYGVETAKSYGWYKIIIPEKEGTMISDWLNEHGNPEIEKKVEREAILKYGEPKQETLEEAAEKHSKKMWGVYFDDIHPDVAITKTQGEISIEDFIEGAKWQQERMYSEEEVFNLLCKMPNYFKITIAQQTEAIKEWFEQFKKK